MGIIVAIVLTYFVVMFFKTSGNHEYNIIERNGVFKIVRLLWWAPFLDEAHKEDYKTFDDADTAVRRFHNGTNKW
jgi:hypothetical protein